MSIYDSENNILRVEYTTATMFSHYVQVIYVHFLLFPTHDKSMRLMSSNISSTLVVS